MGRKRRTKLEELQRKQELAESAAYLRETFNPCYHCGDRASCLYEGRRVCEECYDELRFGKIVNQNVSFFGGRSNGRGDSSPWQENAVRILEADS